LLVFSCFSFQHRHSLKVRSSGGPQRRKTSRTNFNSRTGFNFSQALSIRVRRRFRLTRAPCIFPKQDSGLTANWLPFAASAGGGGITAINAQSGPTVTIAAGTSGTDFAVSSSANTITLNLPTASSTKRGALSSTDWSAFNGKEPAISAGTTSQYWRGDKSWQTLDKSAVGLPNVDNTSDASKPISTATQTALDLKADLASPTFTGTVSGITKSMVGLGNADNTSDATKNAAIATLTNKSIDAASNTITNIGNAEIKALAGIDPTKIGGGSVDNTEYSYLNGVTSAIQTQIDGKEPAITLLPLSKGGTNKNMTAVAGGVVYTDADSQEVLAAGSSGQILQSNATSAPSWVNKSISGKAQNASSVTVEEIQFPNDSLTQTASGKYLAQTGNNNILANPSVEHSTVQSNWSLTNGSSAVETSAVIQGQQSIKLTLTAQALEFFQTSTRYAAQFADGVQGAASIRVKTSVSGVFACPVQNSAIQYSLCAAHSGDGKWALLKVPFVLGGTNNGIAIISGTMSSGTVTPGSITGTVYVDDAYVGTDAGIADVSIITPWVAYTPTFTGFGLSFPAGTFSTAPSCQCNNDDGATRGCAVTSQTTSGAQVTTFQNGSTAANSPFSIECSKVGADYISSRTITGSFKEVMTAPGVTKPKTCYYAFGGASATLASPTECTTGTCTEVYDSCGTGAPPVVSSTSLYTNLTYSAGTFANSSYVHCTCESFDTTAQTAGECAPYFDTGDSTWSTNSSGGLVLNLFGKSSAGSSATGYVTVKCEGQAP
jgi:hypothetical protein